MSAVRDLISVIVIDENGSMFRERCLNSIKRQTYAETETIVTTGENGSSVMEVCHKARGNYLFFCSVTSIIQDNTIEELYRKTQDGVLVCANIYTKGEGVDYQRYSGDISLYGKLFRKSRLLEISLLTDEADLLWRYEMLLKYMAGGMEMVYIPQTVIYETSLQSLEAEEVCRENILHRFYERLEAVDSSTKTNMQKIVQLEREEPDTEEKGRYIKYSYGYYEDRAEHTACLLVKKEYPVLQKVYEVQREAACVPAAAKELNGVELSEYVIQKFLQGNLGLKTIVKAMAAWLKYKLGAGGTHE